MKLQETAQGLDLPELLLGEQGKFKVTSPEGGSYIAECRHGHSISSLVYTPGGFSDLPPVSGAWNVKKIAILGTEQSFGNPGGSFTTQGQTIQRGQQDQPGQVRSGRDDPRDQQSRQ